MEYHVIEIAKGADEIKGKAIYTYNTKEKAIASYHKKLGVAYDSPLYKSDLVMVIDEYGAVILKDPFVAQEVTEDKK